MEDNMDKSEQNTMLLDDAYKNVRMGSYAIDCIISKIKDEDLRNLLLKQDEFYLQQTKELEDYAKKISHKPKDLDTLLKTSSFLNINMHTLLDKETSHIAELLIKGTTMGITTLIKEVNDNPSAHSELINISNNIISHQEKFVESLKDFL